VANTLLQKHLRIFFLFICFIGVFFLIEGTHKAFANSENDSVEEYFKKKELNNNQSEVSEQKEKQNIDATANESDSQVGVTFLDIVRTVFALVFVVALLYFLLKWIQKKSRNYQSTKLLENLGGTQLGGNKSVQLVRVGEKILVIGVGENVQLLSEITDPVEVKTMLTKVQEQFEQTNKKDIFQSIFSNIKEMQSTKKDEPTKFKQLFQKQLTDMSKRRKELYDEIEKKGKQER
jgi:flagellar protein FliO/FliZ